LAERFWPGALTLVVPKGPVVPVVVSAGAGVAVRVPDHPIVPELVCVLGVPLAVTSANLSGQQSPSTADEVVEQLGGRIPLVLDGGKCEGGIPSTVVDLTQSPPAVLREGGISKEALESLIRSADDPGQSARS
jgi:L-threonylcarbamoyladenylate synthase